MSLSDIIKRRMTQTGETEEEATSLEPSVSSRRTSSMRNRKVGSRIGVTRATRPTLRPRVRSRPVEIQAIARQFPPLCLVKAKEGVAIVIGHELRDGGRPVLGVRAHPQSTFITRVVADEVEVVGFCGHLTLEWVRSTLA